MFRWLSRKKSRAIVKYTPLVRAASAAVRQMLDAPPKPLVETLEPRRLYSA